MSRTKKHCPGGGWERRSRFQYRQKKIQGARGKGFRDYDYWDGPKACGVSKEAYVVAKRLYEKGWVAEDIIRRLRERYGISQQEARDCLPWDMITREDGTDKPY